MSLWLLSCRQCPALWVPDCVLQVIIGSDQCLGVSFLTGILVDIEGCPPYMSVGPSAVTCGIFNSGVLPRMYRKIFEGFFEALPIILLRNFR